MLPFASRAPGAAPLQPPLAPVDPRPRLSRSDPRTEPPMKLPPPDSELGKLMATLPQAGTLDWIGLRPKRDVAMNEVDEVVAETGAGLVGDRYSGGSGKRGITLIQAEHLPVIATLSG